MANLLMAEKLRIFLFRLEIGKDAPSHHFCLAFLESPRSGVSKLQPVEQALVFVSKIFFNI